MLIKPDEKYIPSLIKLWREVFGDSEEYIKLFFKKAYFDGECFGEIVGDEVVSAFYLLKCSVRYAGKVYEGRYLYAAATLGEYRRKGLMSALIAEATAYCKDAGLDFIALVPASDSLYDYYSGFGFKEAMYKYRFVLSNDFVTLPLYREAENYAEFYKIRSSAENALVYGEVGCEYAFDCLDFLGKKVVIFGENSYYIDGEELFTADTEETAASFLSSLSGERVIYSNKPLRSAEKVRNGMMYCFDGELSNKEIYMNIALD